MNRAEDLNELLRITQIAYDRQQDSFQKFVVEENRLRRDLDLLDQSSLRARAGSENNGGMRAIGADIIWQGWVSQSRTQLNQKLARVLVQKSQQLSLVKKAYGKVMVVKEMQEKADRNASLAAANIALAKAIDHSIRY